MKRHFQNLFLRYPPDKARLKTVQFFFSLAISGSHAACLKGVNKYSSSVKTI